jgi:hypothetical protein
VLSKDFVPKLNVQRTKLYQVLECVLINTIFLPPNIGTKSALKSGKRGRKPAIFLKEGKSSLGCAENRLGKILFVKSSLKGKSIALEK